MYFACLHRDVCIFRVRVRNIPSDSVAFLPWYVARLRAGWWGELQCTARLPAVETDRFGGKLSEGQGWARRLNPPFPFWRQRQGGKCDGGRRVSPGPAASGSTTLGRLPVLPRPRLPLMQLGKATALRIIVLQSQSPVFYNINMCNACKTLMFCKCNMYVKYTLTHKACIEIVPILCNIKIHNEYIMQTNATYLYVMWI